MVKPVARAWSNGHKQFQAVYSCRQLQAVYICRALGPNDWAPFIGCEVLVDCNLSHWAGSACLRCAGTVLTCGKDNLLKTLNPQTFEVKQTFRAPAPAFSVGTIWCTACFEEFSPNG